MLTKKVIRPALAGFIITAAITANVIAMQDYRSGIVWAEPKVVTPSEKPGDPPSDAIILFDGKDLSKWNGGDQWIVQDGYAIVQKTDITTKDSFGDCQLHVEWAEPEKVSGDGQGRGNSGVFLSNRYELQVLDSYDNKTYFDGQCAAFYKQIPPMVNACRKPGEWQSYDIIYEAPRFDEEGKLLKPGIATVLQNGILVQNHYELQGDTPFDRAPAYKPHPVKQPIKLQNHGNPVRYRNIWIREIAPIEGKKPDAPK